MYCEDAQGLDSQLEIVVSLILIHLAAYSLSQTYAIRDYLVNGYLFQVSGNQSTMKLADLCQSGWELSGVSTPRLEMLCCLSLSGKQGDLKTHGRAMYFCHATNPCLPRAGKALSQKRLVASQ